MTPTQRAKLAPIILANQVLARAAREPLREFVASKTGLPTGDLMDGTKLRNALAGYLRSLPQPEPAAKELLGLSETGDQKRVTRTNDW